MAGSFKHGYGLDIHGRDDVLMCGSTVVTIANTSDLINFFVPASDGSTYAFGSAGSIYAVSGNPNDPVVTFVYNDENGKIRGAAEWEDDDGNNYLIWTTNSSVARATKNGSLDAPWASGVVTQNWKVELVDPQEWHPLGQAGGALMMGNGNFLAKLDYDLSWNPIAMNLRPGNLIKCLAERDDYVILGSTRGDNNEEGHLWSWITTATNYVQKKRIPIKGVNALIETEFMILQGGADGEFFLADFETAPVLARIPGGGATTPGGVSILNDLAVFGIYGGSYPGIWSYGRRGKNRSTALNYEYRLADTIAGSSIASIGAVAVVNGDLMVGWGTTETDSSRYGIDMVSSTTRATALYEGLEFDGGAPHLQKFYNNIVLTMSPLPSGCSVSAKFKMDKESAWRYAVCNGDATTFSTAGETLAIFNVEKPGRIYEVGIELTPSGANSPEIQSVATYIAKESTEYGNA